MKKNYYIVGLVILIFFIISLISNILNPLYPKIQEGFQLSLGLTSVLTFSFFIAYGFMSIPAGILVEKYGEKKLMITAFVLALIGSLVFAVFPAYGVAIPSLFTIGIGMAILQVAINPLLRVSGGEANFAFFSVLAQLAFGGASYLSPHVSRYLIINLENIDTKSNGIINIFSKIVPDNLSWVSLYWVFAILALLMIILIYFSKIPKVDLASDEKSGSRETYLQLFKNKKVILFFLGILAYTGTEQGIANYINPFLEQYHGVDAMKVGAGIVSKFWLLLTLGCFLGLVLLKLFDSRNVLKLFALLAMASLTFALFGSKEIAFVAFPLVGFFASVMWSVIFSLALNSMSQNHGSFSGILVTGIIGAAIIPLIIGRLSDVFSLKIGMIVIYLALGYIFSIGFWAKPLINNKTIKLEELFQMISKQKK